jgi:hypothetical protein
MRLIDNLILTRDGLQRSLAFRRTHASGATCLGLG